MGQPWLLALAIASVGSPMLGRIIWGLILVVIMFLVYTASMFWINWPR
jgi:hypothetical protein